MQRYFIECNQGTGFCSWSYDEPPTRKEIINHFNEFRITENMEFPKRVLSLKFISDFWQVSIRRV